MQAFVFNIIVDPIVFSTSCLLVYDFNITPVNININIIINN